MGKTYGCSEQFICASALYPMSVLSQFFSVIIDLGIIAPGNCKEVADGLNYIDKWYIHKLMSNVQLPGSKIFYSYILMHFCTQNNDIILAK